MNFLVCQVLTMIEYEGSLDKKNCFLIFSLQFKYIILYMKFVVDNYTVFVISIIFDFPQATSFVLLCIVSDNAQNVCILIMHLCNSILDFFFNLQLIAIQIKIAFW